MSYFSFYLAYGIPSTGFLMGPETLPVTEGSPPQKQLFTAAYLEPRSITQKLLTLILVLLPAWPESSGLAVIPTPPLAQVLLRQK